MTDAVEALRTFLDTAERDPRIRELLAPKFAVTIDAIEYASPDYGAARDVPFKLEEVLNRIERKLTACIRAVGGRRRPALYPKTEQQKRLGEAGRAVGLECRGKTGSEFFRCRAEVLRRFFPTTYETISDEDIEVEEEEPSED